MTTSDSPTSHKYNNIDPNLFLFFAPYYVIIGIYVEHIAVLLNGIFDGFTNRRGIVSLLHLLFWFPGYSQTINELYYLLFRTGSSTTEISSLSQPFLQHYQVWCSIMVVLFTISFIFDVRDAITVLYYLSSRKIPFRKI